MKYELSLSRNYVSNWTTSDAIREILQNAIDSNVDGHDMLVEYENNTLVISNKGVKLDPSILILGGGNKTQRNDQIGGFSEGLKIALLVLLRNGNNVAICNDDCLWTPLFEYSDTFGTEILKIKSTDIESCCKFSVEISGIENDYYCELIEQFPVLNDSNYGEIINTEYGQVLLDERFKGKMYVSGLFVEEDDSFELGYNFKPEVVKLDRDRKAINHYELLTLTSKSLISAEECNKQVFNAITNSAADCEEIIDVLDEASEKFLSEYVNYLAKDKEIDDINDVIIATPQMARFLKNEGYETVEGTEVESYLFAKYKNEVEVIEDLQNHIDSFSNLYQAWVNFKDSKFKELLEWVNELGLSDRDIDCFFTRFQYSWNFVPSYYHYIRDEIREEFPLCLSSYYIDKRIGENSKNGNFR